MREHRTDYAFRFTMEVVISVPDGAKAADELEDLVFDGLSYAEEHLSNSYIKDVIDVKIDSIIAAARPVGEDYDL